MNHALPINTRAVVFGLVLCAATAPGHALAQRTTENATTQSSDAFGTQIGMEKTGLYSSEEVRGFSPIDAGNARIEGLYYDQVDRLPIRIADGNSVRVGISAQRFLFPAPTGLVDHTLKRPGSEARASLDIDTGAYLGPGLGLDFKFPIDGTRLGFLGGFGGREVGQPDGTYGRFRNYGAALVWQPRQGAEFMVFVGAIHSSDLEARPTLFPRAGELPPHMKRGQVLSQPWSDRKASNRTTGTTARIPLGSLAIEAGLFRNVRDTKTAFADILSGVAADGSVASRSIIADGNAREESLSGELRLVKQWRSGDYSYRLVASLRGRHRQRLFGGAQRIALGPSSVLLPDLRAMPAFTLGPKNDDDVRQLTYGLAWSLTTRIGAGLDFGLSKSDYRKRIDFADPALGDAVNRDHPLLWNASMSVPLSSRLTLYAGLSRGMEEALVAPDIASNRAEAPPAIRTQQEEAGLRYQVTKDLSLVAGVFRIAKPYYNLDPARRYRQLGTISIKGVELSLTGQLAPGLTLVGGTVLTDSVIEGEAVDSGLIGSRPVGQAKRRTAANLDWRLDAGKSALSIDLGIESFSSRIGDAANTISAPARSSINLGARYRFAVGKVTMVLRPRIENLFDSYGWLVSPSGGFTYAPGRTALLQLLADF